MPGAGGTRPIRRLLFLALLLAGPAQADFHNIPADLAIECNRHGAKVTVRSGLAAGEVFYLGRACDAVWAGHGEGRWYYAASAFLIEAGGETWRFANDLSCPALPYCRPE